MPRRILILVPYYPPMWSPEGDHIMHLARHFEEAGDEVHVLTSPAASTGGNPRIYNTVRTWGWAGLPEIRRTIRRVKPDAILLMYVGWMFKYHPMGTLLPTIVRRINPKIEFVSMITNAIGSKPTDKWRSRMLWKIAAKLAGGADEEFGTLLRDSARIAVLSEPHLKKLVAKDPAVAGKSVLIPPPPILHLSPIDPQIRAQTRAKFGIAEDEFVFTFFGYGYPSKGIETLIAAFGMLLEKLPKIKLMFVGRLDFAPAGKDGRPYSTVLLEPAQRWISRVITTEYDAKSDEGSRFLRAADVCVLPFDLGMQLNNSSVAGSSVHGLPLISTFGENLESAFVDGENVMLVPPKQPELMAAAMYRLATEPELRAKLSAGAEKLAREWFGWDRTLTLLFSEKGDPGV